MWANEEILDLINWLSSFNQTQTAKKIGFYGLDVYSLWESIDAIIDYLEKINSPTVEKAKKAIECIEPFHRQPEKYGMAAAFHDKNCFAEIQALLQTIQENKQKYEDPEAALNLKINAIAASNAENYYQTMVTNDQQSWNIRDHHMAEALQHIGDYYGPEAKGIIWAHNTHIGDARATDMVSEGMVNLGQLTREQYGQDHIFSIGFGTHHGTVIAAKQWGDRAEIMPVPKATSGSWEYMLHSASVDNKYLIFTDKNQALFREIIGHRAIGVTYHPELEHHGNYVPSRISERYDAFIYLDASKALSPLVF